MEPNQRVEEVFRLSPPQKKGLTKLGIENLEDLLYHLPSRYQEKTETKNISDLVVGEKATVLGKILSTKIKKAYHKKIPIAEMTIEDSTGKIKAVWYNQAYMAKKIPEGRFGKITGTVTERKGLIYIANPLLEEAVGELPIFKNSTSDSLVGIYPESRGVSSLWIHYAILKALGEGVHEKLTDPIPEDILKKYNLPKLSTALFWIHNPKKPADAKAAGKRFAFQEIFIIQLARAREREDYRKNPAFKIAISEAEIEKFIQRFPFELTGAQKKAIGSVVADLNKDEPMMRLLEGDVGSGKTAVAAATVYGVTITKPEGQDFGNLQTAYMVPTEILAKQQFESFIKYFEHLGINIGLLTGKECRKFPSKINPKEHTKISRSQLLKWVASGEIPVIVGTHTLIQKSVKFKHLAYVIIDEQHRFGTKQRGKLTKNHKTVPHLLSMTATPIPRTLALTIYGDLDLTVIDEMPKDRKEVKTKIIPPGKRDEVYEFLRNEIKSGRQAYVICPRIDEPDPDKELALNVKSAKAEEKRLKKDIFPEFEIDLVHGKLKPKDKEEVMTKFAEGKTDILVSTSVVEVGVNVENATTIIIEGAERFGLAQLHQLRGRVLRSSRQAHCFLFSDSISGKTSERLGALVKLKNGFALAELDLDIRGAGPLVGTKQWGITDVGMEALRNLKMVEAARTEAKRILESNQRLSEVLLEKTTRKEDLHFE